MPNKSKSCTVGVARIYRAEKDHLKVMAVKLRCGRWDCPDCAERKATLIRERLSAFMKATKTWMYTFTFIQDKPPLDKWQEMPEVWNLFRTRITQKYGRFNYIRVVESHKETPYPHLHVVADVNISDRDFGKIAVECGFGYQLDKRECNEFAPHYVTKYLTKAWENQDSIFLRQKCKIRIVSWSRGLSKLWALPPAKPTVSVFGNVQLSDADGYARLFESEFTKEIIIEHQNTYRRGHIWHIKHPNIHPLDLLQQAIPKIVFAKSNKVTNDFILSAGGELSYDVHYIGTT